ncbi:hypothetical protein [Zobellella taiwanensis]
MIKSKFYLSFFSFLTILCVFLISLFFIPYYIYGDQVHYQRVYDGVSYFNLFDAYNFYKANIDSKEPVYFLLSWVSSTLGIDKVYFIAFFNVLLSFFAYKYFTKIGGHPFVVFLIVTFGYYSYVLFFSAERLKFGFLFLLIGLLYSKRRYIYYVLSVLSHAQMIGLLSSFVVFRFKDDVLNILRNNRVSKNTLFLLMSGTIVSVLVFFIMRDHLLSKINSYFELRGVFELIKLGAFFILSYFYAKDKSNAVALFVPLFFLVLIFGGERINFLGYFVFLYFALQYKKGFNLGNLFVSSYFFYTGAIFLWKIFKYGNGFYSV